MRVRRIKQQDRYSCGPVALSHALASRGIKVGLSQLKKITKTSQTKKGCFRLDFLKAAHKLKLELLKTKPAYLKSEGEFVVLFIAEEEGESWGHFVYVKDGFVYNLDGRHSRQIKTRMDWIVKAAITRTVGSKFPQVWKVK